jgi:hypothetical protein
MGPRTMRILCILLLGAALGDLAGAVPGTRSMGCLAGPRIGWAQETATVIAAGETSGQPGDSVSIAVTTSLPITAGSSDLVLVFDPNALRATTAVSTLENFTVSIDNTAGRVATASATGGPGDVLAAGATLFTATFGIAEGAPAGCTPLGIEDGDGSPPDDLGGPVPPIPPVSITYEPAPGRVCVCAPCDDGDACTTDTCSVDGCVAVERPPAQPDAVTCNVVNLRAALEAPPQPACAQRCARNLGNRFDRIEDLIVRGAGAVKTRSCLTRLRAAARVAKRLERSIARRFERGVFVPVERGVLLAAEAPRLRERARTLARDYCRNRPEPGQ